MPCTCLQIVVDVAGSFGLQNQELNISLTSIGLLVRFLVKQTEMDVVKLQSWLRTKLVAQIMLIGQNLMFLNQIFFVL